MKKVLVVFFLLFVIDFKASCVNEAGRSTRDLYQLKKWSRIVKRQTQCAINTQSIQQISVNDDVASTAFQLAGLRLMNFDFLKDVLSNAEILIKDTTAPLFEALATPSYIDDQVKSTNIIEIVFKLLNEFFRLLPGVKAQYSSSAPIPNCDDGSKRINQDSKNLNCSAADSYNAYQSQGACLNPNKPGIGLAYRQMTRIGRHFCTIDEENSICKLPSARSVSLAIAKMLDGPAAPRNAFVPNMFMLSWFQFVVHETSQAHVSGSTSGEPAIAACGSNRRKLPSILRSPHTSSIEVPCDDPFYSRFKVQCLDFVRNRKLNENCKIEESNFLNSVSSVMDLNTVYEKLNTTSRSFESLIGSDGKLLKDSNKNFIIGHSNNNQHTQLTALNILFCNMHDLIVDELRRLNRSIVLRVASGIAKKILIAMYQQVFYTEVLPLFVGTNNSFSSTANNFDESANPQISQEFSAAAGRQPHKFLQDTIVLASPDDFKVNQTMRFRETFGNVNLAQSQFQRVVCGAVVQQWRTAGVSPELQNNLFFDPRLQYGTDLFAIDTERGRDACLEPFINYSNRIFRKCITKWSDLNTSFPAKAITELQKLYKNVGDLELFPAGMVENRVGDSLMGSLFTFIITNQFEHIKSGDPKFFTKSLTPAQSAEIKKMNLKDFVCVAGKLTKCLNDMRFGFIKDDNDVVDCKCKNISDCLDLSVFLKK